MIKTFRGLIVDGGIDSVPLTTRTGSTGYRVVKFQIMTPQPGAINTELVVKIYKVPQAGAATATVDFSDPTLLAVATFQQAADSWNTYDTIIFDREIFNQDIYVTCQDTQNADGANYYLELEQIKLSDNENTVATLKDIRANA